MGRNNLRISKFKRRCNCQSLRENNLFHPILYWACDHLSMLGLKLTRLIKRVPVDNNYNRVNYITLISLMIFYLYLLVIAHLWLCVMNTHAIVSVTWFSNDAICFLWSLRDFKTLNCCFWIICVSPCPFILLCFDWHDDIPIQSIPSISTSLVHEHAPFPLSFIDDCY